MRMILSRWTIGFLLVLHVSACERRTTVRLEGANPPTFILRGSGVLGGLRIYGPEPESVRSPTEKEPILWEIEEENMRGEAIEKLHSITYGIVPDGYKQIIPQHGEPLPLITGKRYRYDFVTGEAPGAMGYFEIRNGEAVSIDTPTE